MQVRSIPIRTLTIVLIVTGVIAAAGSFWGWSVAFDHPDTGSRSYAVIEHGPLRGVVDDGSDPRGMLGTAIIVGSILPFAIALKLLIERKRLG